MNDAEIERILREAMACEFNAHTFGADGYPPENTTFGKAMFEQIARHALRLAIPADSCVVKREDLDVAAGWVDANVCHCGQCDACRIGSDVDDLAVAARLAAAIGDDDE